MRAFLLSFALVLASLAGQPLASAEPALPPSPSRWFTDNVGFVSPTTAAQVDSRLAAYQRATGHQVVVWIGDTIEGGDLADWAVRTFATWKVGRKGLDDGVTMFVLAQDKKIDIEVGYGLEDRVTDAIAKRTIDAMAERIRAGDRDGALVTGVDSLLAAIEGKPFEGGGQISSAPPRTRGPMPLGQKIFMGIVALAFLILFITNPRLAMLLLWSMASRGSGGGFGGGGGGSDGGFSGGGGRSGGGGARGGW